MTTFVLIPGACHGAWCFEPLARELRLAGHQAYPLTLTGVGERRHLLGASVNLDTHIEDLVNLLTDEQITDAVLVGHSYGGMVITGAADRLPERVSGLVYVDAFVPRDGDSCWTLTTDSQRDWYIGGSAASGHAMAPLPFFDERATPHPLATLLQAIRLTGAGRGPVRRDYVYATDWPEPSPFEPAYRQALADPSWHTHALDSRHNVMRDAPAELLRILLESVRRDGV
ncbi:alpha/beta fold hydrolase [Kitasatospora nipponensis]|uniref:Alpha/beta fold hydrolase n=1 Tax=Kitasatospora nipponensis TaxID=258049 RepID=A0ABN1WHK4_9ACTN